MGFLNKLKQMAGIGGIKLSLEIPAEYRKEDLKFSGKVIVTSESDQWIKELKVELEETFTRKNGDQMDVKNYSLGDGVIAKDIEMKTGETKEFDFNCDFDFSSYEYERLKEEKNDLEITRSVKGFMDREKSKWSVSAIADVKDSLLGANTSKEVKLTGNVPGSFADKLGK